ncbi:MAG: Transcription elongation factor GreA [Calditrichaeota bacterium]|nr:Transcription elongation factor GreA [Calditrichota bacterium]
MGKERIDAIRQSLQHEIAAVRRELEVELPVRIDEARQKGDLSENAEYEAARERQSYLSVRLMQLRHRLSRLSAIDLNEIDKSSVGLYSVADLEETGNGARYSYELVLAEEMDVNKGMISILSPVGQQLRGAKAGETVTVETPARTFELKVLGFTNILGERYEP